MFARWLLVFCLLALEPTAWGGVFHEDFSSSPEIGGWKTVGDSSLFHWNPAQENLEVTWDSSRPNSFFHRSLGTVLGKDDDFTLSFELKLDEIRVGVQPDKPFTFQLAVSFLNLPLARSPQFIRGTGSQSPSLVEFNYFPDSGFGATISPAIISTNGQFMTSFSFPLELTTGDLFRVTLSYRGNSQTLATRMTKNGAEFGPIKDVRLAASFTDFRVDTLAVSSYSDAAAGGSLFARGVLDNLSWEVPDGPIRELAGALANQRWQVEFVGRTNWIYALERTEDFRDWTVVSPKLAGSGERQVLLDEMSGAPRAASFYRLKAERP
jgi:hypothetical protein